MSHCGRTMMATCLIDLTNFSIKPIQSSLLLFIKRLLSMTNSGISNESITIINGGGGRYQNEKLQERNITQIMTDHKGDN